MTGKSYKFRIYPNGTQKDHMEKTFGCCRKVYNYYLEMRKTAWETEKKNISGFDCMKDLTNLKKTDEFIDYTPRTLDEIIGFRRWA